MGTRFSRRSEKSTYMFQEILRLRTKVLKKVQGFWHKPERSDNVLDESKLVIYYRISDKGYPKIKPDYINNERCLRNAVSVFPPNSENKWVLMADNCSDSTMGMIRKYLPDECIHQFEVGHGAGTFYQAFLIALKNSDNTAVYFLENDYLHRRYSREVLLNGLKLAPFVTLYDHPNKYNTHFTVKEGGELSTVILGSHCHWKTTHSTTMTFATTSKFLKLNREVFERWLTSRHPYDCEIFMDLKLKGYELISPIPGFSTHGETEFLGPLVNWSEVEESI